MHFPQQLRDRVRLIICDGDKNECSQIDSAIKSGVFPNAVRSRCIWHIVDRGGTRLKPSAQLGLTDPSVGNYNRNKHGASLKKAGQLVKNWCYSFADNSCKSKVEYDISVILLKRKINKLSTTLGNTISTEISKFLVEHVFPHEQEMCFYPRKMLPMYYASINTPHKGHHNGIK